MSDKVSEANECYKNAEKYLKSGFLKRPDFDNAANEYARAATCFKAARLSDKCLDANLKAADCHLKNKSFFSAAKCYEQSAMILKEMNDWNGVIKYYEKAAHLFRENGIPDTAALTLNRGAQMIEAKNPEKAAEWYCMACEVTMLEDRPRNAAEFANKAVRIYLKLKRYDDAIEWNRKAINYMSEAEDSAACGRSVVCIVIIQLARDDVVAARKAFNEGKCYVEENEIYTVTQLIDGFDQMDPNLIYQALNSPFIKSLDNEYAKLARALQQKYAAEDKPKYDDSQSEATNDEAGSML